MKTKLFLSIAAVAALAGCAHVPNNAENATADHGPYPVNYEEVVHAWIKTTFFDPYSIQDLSISKPVRGWRTGAPLFGEKPVTYGWTVFVKVNGKNRLGAYAGLQTYNLLIRNGKIASDGSRDAIQ